MHTYLHDFQYNTLLKIIKMISPEHSRNNGKN